MITDPLLTHFSHLQPTKPCAAISAHFFCTEFIETPHESLSFETPDGLKLQRERQIGTGQTCSPLV